MDNALSLLDSATIVRVYKRCVIRRLVVCSRSSACNRKNNGLPQLYVANTSPLPASRFQGEHTLQSGPSRACSLPSMRLSSLRQEREGTKQTRGQKTPYSCSVGGPEREARQIPAQCLGHWNRHRSATDGLISLIVLYRNPVVDRFAWPLFKMAHYG